ncbi:MAG TPA: hypothetical protein VL095_00700 [Flavisolibacter sp.]|nr:hypothetical protein [Flavisolibacter sp.]
MKRLQSSLKGIIPSFLFPSKDVRFITVAEMQPMFSWQVCMPINH